MDFDSVAAAGSLLGTAAMIVLDETRLRGRGRPPLPEFYAHESCGKCTPCREGTWWVTRVLGRIEDGHGRPRTSTSCDERRATNILFKAFCALADGAVSPINSSLKFFRDEYEEHVRLGRCPLRRRARPSAPSRQPARSDADPSAVGAGPR